MPLRRYSFASGRNEDAGKLHGAGHSPGSLGGTSPSQTPPSPPPRRARSRSTEKLPPEPILMEGPLRKKGARVNMWSSRQFVLRGARLLIYRKKGDESNVREVVIVPGCFVSEIHEVPYQKRSLYEFRLHWPPHVNSNGISRSVGAISKEGEDNGAADLLESDEEDDALAKLADRTAKTAKKQKTRAAEIEKSEIQHQSSVSKGAAVAGVAITGVVVGAFTAGIGLVPYLAVVGAAVAAGGGAVAYTASKTGASRIVMAAETEAEAIRWKAMLEMEIAVCEGRRPPPPPEIDLQDVERWIHSTNWRAVGVLEGGLRILEEEQQPPTSTSSHKAPTKRCRKTQVVLQAAPIKVFLSFMSVEGSMEGLRRAVHGVRMLQQIDDHTDVIHFTLPQPQVLPRSGGLVRFVPRDFVVMRYWRLDDDGSYVVCLNSITHASCPEVDGVVRGALHCVLAIAPRKDYAEFEEDLAEALITYIVEVEPKGWASKLPLARAMYADMILTQVLDVKEYVDAHRFKSRELKQNPSVQAPTVGRHSSFDGGVMSVGFSSPVHSASASSMGMGSTGSHAVGSLSPTKRSGSISRLTDKLRGRKRHYSTYSKRVTRMPSVSERSVPQTAAALRNSIQAKEYEVHRLEVEIGRSAGGASQRSSDLLQQLHAQLLEIETLKQKYKALTGRDWHHYYQQAGPNGAVDPVGNGAAMALAMMGPSANLGTPSTGAVGGRQYGGPSGAEDGPRKGARGEVEGDDLDFDDEGVPSTWVVKSTGRNQQMREVLAKLAFVLVFCGAFFAALHCRALLELHD